MTPRVILLAGMINAAITGTAFAQVSDATDSVGQAPPSSAFGRDRNVSVMEREHPEYDPVPIHVGILELTPSMAIGTGYDDNLYAVNAPRIGDAYLHIVPRLKIVRPSPNLKLTLNGEFDLTRYASRISENQTNYRLDGGAHYVISNDTTLDLTGLYGRFAQERTEPDSPALVQRPIRFTISEATGTVTHVFNRLRVRGVLDVENRNYRDGRDALGNVVDEDFRDRTTVTGTGIVEYALSPSISLFGAGSYNIRDYRTRIGPVPARDSQGYEAAVGSSFELGAKIRGSLRLGYLEQKYREPFFADIRGMLVRGDVEYFLTPLVTLTGTIDRRVNETGILGAAGYLSTTMTLRADYELLRNLILSASVEKEARNFNNIDRDDDRWTYRASGTYRLSPRVALRADVLRRSQSSVGTVLGREFEKMRVSFGVTLSGL
ncbi:outer membrane beta-barrel protein [Sphingomonas mali]|uniref:outer membrane beta-barrel protein n=1 Tax=Sphingomonas mali TaxID=40682 RepID=UPI0008355D43|nr:outer membrane beta-barrel protein [Sphingomonas mali]